MRVDVPVFRPYLWSLSPCHRQRGMEARDFSRGRLYDSDFSDEEVSVLEAVYETYGPLSGEQLESITHHEDPWIEARGNLKPWEPGTTPISIESMRKSYGKKYAEAQND